MFRRLCSDSQAVSLLPPLVFWNSLEGWGGGQRQQPQHSWDSNQFLGRWAQKVGKQLINILKPYSLESRVQLSGGDPWGREDKREGEREGRGEEERKDGRKQPTRDFEGSQMFG